MDDLFSWAETRAAVATPPLERPFAPVARPTIEPAPTIPEIGPIKLLREPRPFQEVARQRFHESRNAGERRGMIVMGTGAGKTVEFSILAADLHPGRTLVLTDQFDLVDQAVTTMRATTGIFADVEQGDRKASRHAKVVVATVQTLRHRLEKYAPDTFDLVVADECDRAVAPMWKEVLGHFQDHAYVLGVTATPNRHDRKSVIGYFEKKLFEISCLELIEQGYLVPITVEEVPLEIDLSDVATTKGDRGEDYNPAELAKAVQGVFAEVCEVIKRKAARRRILIFLPNVETSKGFVAVAHAAGLNARHVDGTSRDRDEVKQAFREGKFQILANPMLLGRGYDDPGIDCIINLRPTQSLAFYQQIVGRGTRLHCPHGCGKPCTHLERKRDLLVLDFMYQFKGMGPIRPAHLIAETPTQAAAMQKRLALQDGPIDIRDLRDQANHDIQEQLIKAMAEAQKARGGQGEYFNALQWAANLKVEGLMDYEPESAHEAEPIPKGMLSKLKAAGFVLDSVTCLGHAEKILAVVKARKEAGLASFKQVFWLRKWGYRDPWNASAEYARKIMAREFRAQGKF